MTRPGFALIVSLLIAIALSLVGLGALAVGVRESAIAGTVERRARARLRAEAGALAAVERWSSRAHAELDVGQSHAVPHPDARITVFRIDAALFLVQSESEDDSGGTGAGVTARTGLLVRTYPLHRVTDYLPAAITIEETGTIAAGAVVVPDSCVHTAAVLGSVTLLDGAFIAGAVVPAEPDGAGDPFPSDLLAAIANARIEPGRVRPRPLAADGECRPDPLNWGARGPGHPCHDFLPLIHAAGPLVVDGGTGRGIVVVDGDLVLDGGFEFQGILIVRGELTLRGGATVEGAIRATSLRFEDGQVARVPCDLRPVLAGPALDRAFRPSGRWWVPVF